MGTYSKTTRPRAATAVTREGSPVSGQRMVTEPVSPASSRIATDSEDPPSVVTPQKPVPVVEMYQAGPHISCKYTKEELLARHWDLSIEQATRVKALLLMGVAEEDLVVADRLIKMGRDCDCPKEKCSKEEKLLGYTASQRQRFKALHTLGLSEQDFHTCRAILLSSLGPTALGGGAKDLTEAIRTDMRGPEGCMA